MPAIATSISLAFRGAVEFFRVTANAVSLLAPSSWAPKAFCRPGTDACGVPCRREGGALCRAHLCRRRRRLADELRDVLQPRADPVHLLHAHRDADEPI